jgi:hypothetical protein
MAFNDPQVIDLTAFGMSATTNLNKVQANSSGSVFRFEDSTGEMTVEVSHQYGKRNRHLYKMKLTSPYPDPYLDGVSAPVSIGAQLILDEPGAFVTDPDAGAAALAETLMNELLASGSVALTKLATGQL